MTVTIETLWADYRNQVHHFLLSRLDSPADVEDILQTVMLKSYQHLGDVREDAQLKQWLFSIAHNALMDHFRTVKRDAELSAESLWYESEDASEWEDLNKCLLPFLQQLPDEQAHLIRTLDLEGNSQKQMAQELDIPYSTLKSRLHSSRQTLKEVFDSCCQHEIDETGHLIPDKNPSSCKKC